MPNSQLYHTDLPLNTNGTPPINTEMGKLDEAIEQRRVETASERNRAIAAETNEANRRVAGDTEQAQARADEVRRLDDRIDGIQQNVVVGNAPLTTTTAIVDSGDTVIPVVGTTGLLQDQPITIRNALLTGAAGMHASTILLPPSGNTITIADPIPASWVSATAAPIGSIVGTSPPEIANARTPFFTPPDYRGNVPERITLIEKKRVFVRAFRTWAGGDEGKAINMALQTAPAGYTVEAEPGDYVIPYLSRILMTDRRKLLMGDGVLLRPQNMSTTLAELAPAGRTYVRLTDPTGWTTGMRFAFPLSDGTIHFTQIGPPITGNSFSINPPIPSGVSAAANAPVRQWWGRGLIVCQDISGFEIEKGELDGLRESLTNGRLVGIELRGASTGRIAGLRISNMPSSQVDGINNWGNQGDALYAGISSASGEMCRNIACYDLIFRGNDRSGYAITGCDGFYATGGSVWGTRPLDGSQGNLGAGVVFESNDDEVLNSGVITRIDFRDNYQSMLAVATSSYDSGTDTYNIKSRAADVVFDTNTSRGCIGPDILLRGYRNKAIYNTIYLGASYAISIWTARDFEASHNTVFGDYNPNSRSAMHVSGGTDGQIHHNKVWRTYVAPITIDQRNSMKGVPHLTNVSLMFNEFNACVHPDMVISPRALITVQTGYVNRNTDTASSSGDAAAVLTTVKGLTVRHNYQRDERGVKPDYGMYVANTSAEDRATWDVAHNEFPDVTIRPYQGIVVKDRDLPAVTVTATFGAPANGVATATSTVSFIGVMKGDPITAVPMDGAPPAGYNSPEAYATANDTVILLYPVRSGQSPSALVGQSIRLVATKYR